MYNYSNVDEQLEQEWDDAQEGSPFIGLFWGILFSLPIWAFIAMVTMFLISN